MARNIGKVLSHRLEEEGMSGSSRSERRDMRGPDSGVGGAISVLHKRDRRRTDGQAEEGRTLRPSILQLCINACEPTGTMVFLMMRQPYDSKSFDVDPCKRNRSASYGSLFNLPNKTLILGVRLIWRL